MTPTHDLAVLERIAKAIERGDTAIFTPMFLALPDLLAVVRAAQHLAETPEIEMYGRSGTDKVAAGHIGYCVRNIRAALRPFDKRAR